MSFTIKDLSIVKNNGMTHTFKTKKGEHQLRFGFVFLRRMHLYYEHQSVLDLIQTVAEATAGFNIDGAPNDTGRDPMQAFAAISNIMVQLVRCGHEAWRRSTGNDEPVSEMDAENILFELGDSPSDQIPVWGGILTSFMSSVTGPIEGDKINPTKSKAKKAPAKKTTKNKLKSIKK